MRGTRSLRPIPSYLNHLNLHRPQTSLSRPKTRIMSTQREDSIPHELRTAAEPRQNRLYPVRLAHVEQVNRSIRLLQFAIPDEITETSNDDNQQPFSFLPGQWLDVHIPSIANAGGFTITSTPADAQALPSPEDASVVVGEAVAASLASQGRAPYVELAVQDSPKNPPAAWLWKPKEEIVGKEVNIRVGGSFVWPPNGTDVSKIKNVVLIAGGVGINPLISILCHLHQMQSAQPLYIRFLYSSRVPQERGTEKGSVLDEILFLPRIRHIIRSQGSSSKLRVSLDLFLTNAGGDSLGSSADLSIHKRRINEEDVRSAVLGQNGEVDPQESVVYVCGPPAMTDEFVAQAQGILGEGGAQRVFFEKWW